MPVDVIMPALGKAQDTGKVLRWLKRDGASVTKGEPLLEVETDKVTVEVEAPADGTLAGIRAEDGTEVPVGTVIALVLAEGEAPAPVRPALAAAATTAPAAAPAFAAATTSPRVSRDRPLASPKARGMAAERGVDLAAVAGSGPGGAVVAADLDEGSASPGTFEVGTVWRVMAERTQRSWQEVPHFVLSCDVDASRLLSWKDAAREKPGCERLTATDLLVRVCAAALSRHPRVNASWREGAILPGPAVNVAVAVATDDGLVVPVVQRGDTLAAA